MIHILDIPWGTKTDELKEKYKLTIIKGGYYLYSGTLLPKDLYIYASKDFSYNRWLEDERNATVMPPKKYPNNFILHDHQQDVAAKIFNAYENNYPMFIESDRRNIGKTLSSLVGITTIASQLGFNGRNKGTLLIVTTKGLKEKWTNILHHYPKSTALLRVLVINYQQINKLLIAPPQARINNKKSAKDKTTAKYGKPSTKWDFIIFDEAHYLNNPQKNIYAQEAISIAQLNNTYIKGETPFVIFNNSNLSENPIDYMLQANLLAPKIDKNIQTNEILPKNWIDFLKKHNFSIKLNQYGYEEWDTKISIQKKTAEKRKILETLLEPSMPLTSKNYKDINNHYKMTFLPLEVTPSIINSYKNNWENVRQKIIKTTDKIENLKNIIEEYKQKTFYLYNQSIINIVSVYSYNNTPIILHIPSKNVSKNIKDMLLKKKISATIMNETSNIIEEWENFKNNKTKVLIVDNLNFLTKTRKANNKKFEPYCFFYDALTDNNFESEISLIFQKTNSNFVYFPFFRDTLEEEFLVKFDNIIPYLSENEMIKYFKNKAAHKTEIGRLS